MQDVFRNVWKSSKLSFVSVMIWSGLSGQHRPVTTPILMTLISSTMRPVLMLMPLTTSRRRMAVIQKKKKKTLLTQ